MTIKHEVYNGMGRTFQAVTHGRGEAFITLTTQDDKTISAALEPDTLDEVIAALVDVRAKLRG